MNGLFVFLLFVLCAMAAAVPGAEPPIHLPQPRRVIEKPAAPRLTEEMVRLNASPYFYSWVDAARFLYCGLMSNPVVSTNSNLVVGLGAIYLADNGGGLVPPSTNSYVTLSTSAILKEPWILLHIDGAIEMLKADSTLFNRGELEDFIMFPCSEELLRRIAGAKSVRLQVQATRDGLEGRSIDRTLSKVNIGRFQVVVDTFVDRKPGPKISRTAVAAAVKEREKKIQDSRMWIAGPILQKVERGLLVQAGKFYYDEADKFHREMVAKYGVAGAGKSMGLEKEPKKGEPWRYFALCLLKDYPKQAFSVDGELVHVIAYPSGSYSYKAVNGAMKTVRVFTCDPSKVVGIPSDEDLRSMRAVDDYD